MSIQVRFKSKHYGDALKGELFSDNPSEKDHTVHIENNTNLNLCYSQLDAKGNRNTLGIVKANTTSDDSKSKLNVWYLLTNALTGGFVGVFQVQEDHNHYKVKTDLALYKPNDIGLPPQSDNKTIIPQNSWSVVVGIGDTISGSDGIQYVVVREQSWDMSGTSFSLGPFETKEISATHEAGREESSSTHSEIAASIDMQASAGWGPISASASASLSKTSVVNHDVKLQEKEVSFVDQKFENNCGYPLLIFFWKLVDHLTWYEFNIDDGIKSVAHSVSIPVGPMIPLAYSVQNKTVKLLDSKAKPCDKPAQTS